MKIDRLWQLPKSLAKVAKVPTERLTRAPPRIGGRVCHVSLGLWHAEVWQVKRLTQL